MELTLRGNTSLNVEGTVTVELPAYMRTLSDEELLTAIEGRSPDVVIAIGKHPIDGDLVFLTASGELREADLEPFQLPAGDFFPTHGGTQLCYEPVDYEAFAIDVAWARRVSTLMVDVGKLAHPNGARVSCVEA